MGKKGQKRPKRAAFKPAGVDLEAHAKLVGVDPDREVEVFEFLCQALEKPLPDPWQEHSDKKGRIFYWNKASRSSSWQHPMAPTHKSLVAAFRRVSQASPEEKPAAVEAELEAFRRQGEEELQRWRKSFAPDETPYYYKVGTQLTRWDDPRDELMGHMQLRVEMLYALLQDKPAAAQEEEDDQPLGTPLGSGSAVSGALDDSEVEHTHTSPKGRIPGLSDEPMSRVGTAASQGSLASRGHQGSMTSQKEGTLIAMGFSGQAAKDALAQSHGNLEEATQLLLSSSQQVSPLSGSPQGRSPLRSGAMGASSSGGAGTPTQRTSPWGRPSSSTADPWTKSSSKAGQTQQQQSPSGKYKAYRPPIGGTDINKPAEEDEPMESDGKDLNASLVADDIGVNLGICFDEPADMAAYQILKPLFFRPLPIPWQVVPKAHGRKDFYHPALKENRRRHPMFGFFSELLHFLRVHAGNNMPLKTLLEEQVFKEASPQVVRERLGIWEGPLELAANRDGLRFVRQWLGTDEACIGASERHDDPRLEAAANITYRLRGWLHLWKGFVPEEQFPLLEGRMAALSQQVGESVVTAPGMATTQMVAHMNRLVPKIEEPPEEPHEPEMPPAPLTEEEAALQPLVTMALNQSFSVALREAARREAEAELRAGRLRGDTNRYTAKLVCAHSFKMAPPRVARLEYEDWQRSQLPEEEEFEAESDEDYEEETEDDFSEDEKVMEATPEDSEEEQPEEEEPPKEDQPLVHEEWVADLPVVKGFIASWEQVSAEEWASRGLRPLTPQSDGRPEDTGLEERLAPLSPKVPMHRERLGYTQQMWAPTRFEEPAPGEKVPGPPPKVSTSFEPLPPVTEGDMHEALHKAFEHADSSLQEPVDKAFGHVDSSLQEPEGEDSAPQSPLNEQPSAFSQTDIPLAPERQEKVNAFARSLDDATSFFDELTGEDPERDELLESAYWHFGRTQPDPPDLHSTGRGYLSKPDMPGSKDIPITSDEGQYEHVVRGCAARANSPARGAIPPPHYLEAALPPPEGFASGARAFAPKKGERPRSASPRCGWDLEPKKTKRASKGGPIGDPKQAILAPRPNSAGPKLRPGTGLLPHKFSPAAETAAASAKRFLSRECGTMQAALQIFDPTGDGRFSRQEWEAGLKLLDFPTSHDVQEIFSVLDKRQHHMLTLSDLLDYCKGIPIDTGMPPLGIRGQASEIFQEVLDEQLLSIAKEALVDIICDDLLRPRGPINGLPDVDTWLKERGWDPSTLQAGGKPGSTTPTGEDSGIKSGDIKFGDSSISGRRSPGTPGSKDIKKTTDGDEIEDGDGESSEDEELEEEDHDEDPDVNDGGGDDGQMSEKDRAEARSFFLTASKLRSKLGREPKRSEVIKAMLKEDGNQKITKSTVKDGRKNWRRLEKNIQKQVRAALRLELQREPTDEEVAAAILKEHLQGRDPTQQELERETKNVKKVDKSIQIGVLMRLRRQLREQLGREPDEEELAKFKVQKRLGREPTSAEVKQEVRAISKTESKKNQKDGKSGGKKKAGTGEVNKMLRAQDIDPMKLIQEAKKKALKDAGSGKWQQAQDIRSNHKIKKKTLYSSASAGRFPGFGFVDDRESDDGTLPDERMLPWVPRPTSEICKTYSHIYKLLADPRVQKLSKVQRRSVHVKMPGLSSVPGGGISREDSQDALNAEAEPQSERNKNTLSTSGKWASKSSPNLKRPGSGGSDGRGGGVSLPPLAASGQSKKPWVPDAGRPKAADGMGGYPAGQALGAHLRKYAAT
eukprot:TRINITY_DN29024_c0_g2_i1.p1 TRINITY_DN29024_c0_g2~~TRINITY_DN29024_c0_g2_i1.p1  ORF type:complete len:1770 (-),score=379.64 TRINITY_DN29024_c0_g2_i1:217-5505(-)